MRLSKMSRTHVRAIEVLRWLLYSRCGVANLDSRELYVELARRGVIDPDSAIIRIGHEKPTHTTRCTVMNAINLLGDLGLIDEYSDGAHKITHDGKATLLDWDDTAADGVWL